MKKILCIGACSAPKRNFFTGMSVMFDGVVEYLKDKGVQVTIIDIAPKIKKGGIILRALDNIVKLLKIPYVICLNKYELAYITTSQSNRGFIRDRFAITLCRWSHIPVIAHQYGANYDQLINSLDEQGRCKLKRMLEYVSAIIVEGDYMKQQFSFLDNYQSKVIVIPNGLPIEGEHVLIPKVIERNAPFVLFYLSNLIWSKGYFDVLKAMDILVNRDGLDVKCVFSGKFMQSADDEWPGIANKEDFDKFIEQHSLTERVQYFPGLFGEEKDSFFFKSNVFVLPTYYINEGQPVSIIEAMAYGCVPLVTEFRHIPMMINNENGCFVKEKDPEDIAKNVKYLIEHPNDYSSKSVQCITDYQEKFKFAVYANKLMDCFNSVIS